MMNVGRVLIKTAVKAVCIILMACIGLIQAVGTVLTAMSVVIFKTISSLMIFVTLLLQVFRVFTWMKTLVVILIGVSIFWMPEGIALAVLAMTFIQAKLRDIIETC